MVLIILNIIIVLFMIEETSSEVIDHDQPSAEHRELYAAAKSAMGVAKISK